MQRTTPTRRPRPPSPPPPYSLFPPTTVGPGSGSQTIPDGSSFQTGTSSSQSTHGGVMPSSSGIANQHPAGGPALSEPPFTFEQGSHYGLTQDPGYSLTNANSHTGSNAPPGTLNGTSFQIPQGSDQTSQQQANQQYPSSYVQEQYPPGNPPLQQYNQQYYAGYQKFSQQSYGGYVQPSLQSGYQYNSYGQGGYGVHHHQPQIAAYPLSGPVGYGWKDQDEKAEYEESFFKTKAQKAQEEALKNARNTAPPVGQYGYAIQPVYPNGGYGSHTQSYQSPQAPTSFPSNQGQTENSASWPRDPRFFQDTGSIAHDRYP